MTLECFMPKISYGLIITNHRLRKMMSSRITNLEYAQNTRVFHFSRLIPFFQASK